MSAENGRRGGRERIERALRLLDEELRERLARHPQGHLLAGGREDLDLALALPPGASAGRLAEEAQRLDAEIARALEGALAHRAAFRPGRVFCLRCGGAGCEHSLPGGPREVFAGYGPSGLPRFLDFGQLLLERGDPRVDRLFGGAPALLAHTVGEADLVRDLLEAFHDRATGFRVHGQVAAGWYRVPDPATGRPATLAVTLQAVSTQPEGRLRRYGLNVLGRGPTAQALADLARAGGEQLLVDTRRETLVVLGARGRAHLFSPGGKHVTSIRFDPGAVERRRDRRWRPASADEIEALRAAVRTEPAS